LGWRGLVALSFTHAHDIAGLGDFFQEKAKKVGAIHSFPKGEGLPVTASLLPSPSPGW
jgi:hypothetical protein